MRPSAKSTGVHTRGACVKGTYATKETLEVSKMHRISPWLIYHHMKPHIPLVNVNNRPTQVPINLWR